MTRRRVSWFLALGICVVVVANGGASGAIYDESTSTLPNERPILVVVDLSGSMNDPDENGKIKIQGAREAFAALLPGLGGSTRLGVWTYPDDGSCGAGALATRFAPVAGIDAGAITGQWDAGGNTPTAQALRAAAETVALAGGDTIILISDGESNCNADPCAAAEELAAEGIDVVFHTVGFEISDQGDSELQCISSATGGTHTNVANSDELADALAALSEISLTVDLTSEVLDDSANTSFPSARIEVSATVTNTGIRAARDLDLTLRFEGDRRPFLIDGTRTLPFLDGGSNHTATWTFDVPIDCDDYALEYSAFARLGGVPIDSDAGTATVPGRSDSVYCLLTSNGTLTILGDSFSSGEGAPEYDQGTNEGWNRCRRGQTYGRADRVGDPITVLACSGAIIHDLLLPHGEHHSGSADGPLLASQLEQLESLPDDVDVIVLTISGNDIGFADIIKDCVIGSSCSDPASKSQKTTGIALPEDEALSPLRVPLTRALRIVESTVNADRENPVQFVLMSYPDLLPKEGSFPADRDDCPLGVGWLLGGQAVDPAEAEYLSLVQTRLNRVVGLAARDLKGEGRPFHFAASMADAFEGHTLCDQDPWVHGIRLLDRESVHPNNEGYRAMWRALLKDARAENWPIASRDVSVELSVDGGKLCPTDREGEYRILSYADFLTGSRMELERGECIVVVGGPSDTRPQDGDINWSSKDLSTENLADLIERSPGGEEDSGLRSWIAFYIHSEPELLGVARPDENGDFREILWIPDDLPTGQHTLSAVAPDGSGSLEKFTIPVVLVDEPTGPYKAGFGIALAAVLIGAGILTLVPRRSTRETR